MEIFHFLVELPSFRSWFFLFTCRQKFFIYKYKLLRDKHFNLCTSVHNACNTQTSTTTQGNIYHLAEHTHVPRRPCSYCCWWLRCYWHLFWEHPSLGSWWRWQTNDKTIPEAVFSQIAAAAEKCISRPNFCISGPAEYSVQLWAVKTVCSSRSF